MRFSYYPGCTLHSTGAEYGASARAVFECLGIELVEVPDWNCCGASSAHTVDRDLAILLPGRNLLLAQQQGMGRMVVPCAACFGRLRLARRSLAESPELLRRLADAVGVRWEGGVAVESALSVVAEVVDSGGLDGQVRRPLRGLKVAPYYGCLLARPRAATEEANPDHPTSLDRVLSALGAEVMEWSYKTDCCGGGLSLSRSDLVARLVDRLVDRAVEAGAGCIATACPMCQANLEMRQSGGWRLPVLYFTELMGLALGLDQADRWWGKHLIDPRPLLQSVGMG
ncbi:MAG: CoB--CoM heterodisulfide reductase iron-sulfur subunit B family protein [Chloroflexota bacterium]